MSADRFTPIERSAIMRRVKARDTGPELILRRKLTRMGLRYRLHRSDLPGSPDVVFSGRKLAVFVHGCFWHGHDCRRGARLPQHNAAYWADKIARNRVRDRRVQDHLVAMGWRALIVWECELKPEERLEAKLVEALGPILNRSAQRPVEPNPPAPRTVSSSVSTATQVD